MTVYIDQANIPYRSMIMCHMMADSLEELHQMADKIGVQRKWFQNKNSFPHYDVCLSKKALAIKSGAVEIDHRWLYKLLQEYKEREAKKQ